MNNEKPTPKVDKESYMPPMPGRCKLRSLEDGRRELRRLEDGSIVWENAFNTMSGDVEMIKQVDEPYFELSYKGLCMLLGVSHRGNATAKAIWDTLQHAELKIVKQ